VRDSRFKRVLALATMSIVFDVTRSVFSPTEQPRSATFMQLGEESQYNSLIIVSSSMVLVLRIIVLCNKIKYTSIKKKKEIKLQTMMK